MTIEKKWYTIKEMQQHTGFSRTTLYQLGKSEPFKSCYKKVSKRLVRIDAEKFDQILSTYDMQ